MNFRIFGSRPGSPPISTCSAGLAMQAGMRQRRVSRLLRRGGVSQTRWCVAKIAITKSPLYAIGKRVLLKSCWRRRILNRRVKLNIVLRVQIIPRSSHLAGSPSLPLRGGCVSAFVWLVLVESPVVGSGSISAPSIGFSSIGSPSALASPSNAKPPAAYSADRSNLHPVPRNLHRTKGCCIQPKSCGVREP